MAEIPLNLATPSDENYVSAVPTKTFFMAMLVRDITLDDAILDLVDNSVDAANEFWKDEPTSAAISIQLTEKSFEIKDNCGGMDLATAKTKAFRIGREMINLSDLDGSIGQFGIGMKRAIFKFGTHATVKSIHSLDRFTVTIDLPEWKDSPIWGFPFSLLNDVEEQQGATLTVSKLHVRASQEFCNDNFVGEVRAKIRRAHYDALTKGIAITVNEVPLEPYSVLLLDANGISPLDREFNLGEGVKLRITAGVSLSEPKNAGWYVFCGNRMVLAADQSATTGWGEEASTASTPKFHNQYSRFRGIARFIAEDASLLPWNTTKRGVDVSNVLFQKGRVHMVDALKEIVTFLNALDKEYDQEQQPLQDALAAATKQKDGFKSFDQVEGQKRFTYPKTPKIRDRVTITCKVDAPRGDKLKAEIGAVNFRQVGEYCFDFTYKRVIGDEE